MQSNSTSNLNANGDEINEEIDEQRARIEAMVTPEQMLSDSVARKRRRFTKKRSTSLTKRDQTPLRHPVDDRNTTTTSDEEAGVVKHPKTPERIRRRRFNRKLKDFSETESETGCPRNAKSDNELKINPTSVKKSNSIPRQKFTEPLHLSHLSSNAQKDNQTAPVSPKSEKADDIEKPKKRKSLSDLIAQSEVSALISKTKKTISAAATRGRDRFRNKYSNKEKVKRSQSAPHEFTEAELIESFRRAQLLENSDETVDYEYKPIRSRSSARADAKEQSTEIDIKPIRYRPEVQQLLRERRLSRKPLNKTVTPKLIEILDPKTSNVISRKKIIQPTFRLRELFGIFMMYSFLEIYRSYKMYKQERRQEYQRIRALWNRCMCELFIIMLFCGMGGMIFKFTEGSFENYYKCGVKRVKRDFIDQLWLKSHNLREEDWKSLARNKLRNFEEELHAAHEAGMTSYSGQRAWSFLNGVVYAITVITTIGYGHMYPTTITGRALTIVYSIIGIPLFLIALTDFGKLFTRCIKFLWSFVRRLYYTGSCRQVRKTAHVHEIFKGAQMMYEIATFRRPSANDPENPEMQGTDDTPTTPGVISSYEIDDEFNLPISVAIFILIGYIFFGALIYSLLEQWDFFASFYFVFISMSTIGFGDFVPRQPICMIVSIVYLVFGLALMSMCINVVQVKLSDTFAQASQKIGQTIGLEVDMDGSVLTVPPENVEVASVHGSVATEGAESAATPASEKSARSPKTPGAADKKDE